MSLKKRNTELYNKLKSFSAEALKVIANRLNSKNVPIRTKLTWEKVENEDFFVSFDEKIPDYYFMLLNFLKEIKLLPTYSTVVAAIKDDELWEKYFNNWVSSGITGYQKYQIDGVLLEIVEHCLASTNQFNLSEEQLETKVDQIEKYFKDPVIDCVRKVPLYGINIEENLVISKELSIEILSDTDVIELIEKGLISSSYSKTQHKYIDNPPRVALIFKLPTKKIFIERNDSQSISNHSEFDEIYTRWNVDESMALSLLTAIIDSHIAPACVIDKLPSLMRSAAIYQINQVPISLLTRPKKTLTKEEENKFHAFWEIINKNDSKPVKCLRIAVRRYALAKVERSLDDKLIDLMICAEALFLQDGNTELAYKLAHRAALLLGDNNANQQEVIFMIFRRAYNSRSDVIHGNKSYEHSNNKPDINLTELENYLQKALLQMLLLATNSNISNQLVNWDKLMFSDQINE